MTKHAELIARLEAAEVGNYDLTIDVLEALGLPWSRLANHQVTTSLDAAIAPAERLGLDACELLFNVLNEGEVRVGRLPLALCIAILRALDSQINTA